MKANKKLIIGIIVVFGLIGIFTINILSPLTEKGWTKKLFGIDESDYELITRDNQLSRFEYSGEYTMKIIVHKDQMDSFISDIKSVDFYLEEDHNDAITTFVKNTTGVAMDSNCKLYWRMGAVRRNILFESMEPKTVESIVLCSECVDGDYEVYLVYVEQYTWRTVKHSKKENYVVISVPVGTENRKIGKITDLCKIWDKLIDLQGIMD